MRKFWLGFCVKLRTRPLIGWGVSNVCFLQTWHAFEDCFGKINHFSPNLTIFLLCFPADFQPVCSYIFQDRRPWMKIIPFPTMMHSFSSKILLFFLVFLTLCKRPNAFQVRFFCRQISFLASLNFVDFFRFPSKANWTKSIKSPPMRLALAALTSNMSKKKFEMLSITWITF